MQKIRHVEYAVSRKFLGNYRFVGSRRAVKLSGITRASPPIPAGDSQISYARTSSFFYDRDTVARYIIFLRSPIDFTTSIRE